MMQLFYERGDSPFYLKPLQTGCRDPYDADSDARFVYQHVEPLKGKDPAESVIYCFKNPKAPYFAARDEGKEKDIDIKVIQDVVNEQARLFNPIIIEGAGGIFVPVNEDTLMIDLIEQTESKPIIAARAGLGTINHTLLTVEAFKRRGLQPEGIVFIDSGKTQTPQDMLSENIEAVEKVSGVNVAGLIHRIEDFSCAKRGLQPFPSGGPSFLIPARQGFI
jgi:dethiobiotin synthetase